MNIRRSMAVATLAASLGVLAALPAPVFAADPTTPPIAPVAPAVPAAGPSDITRVQPYVQPSIIYVQSTFTGWVWDRLRKEYLNGGKPYKVSGQCTGFVVNSTGYIATAGHCVDPDEVRLDFILRGLNEAQREGLYRNASPQDARDFDVFIVDGEQPRLLDLRVPTESRGEPLRKVEVAWEASVSGLAASDGVPARVVDFQSFDDGDAALLKVEKAGLNAIQLAPAEDPAIGTEVISIGYPGSVDAVTDPNFAPSYKQGSVSKIATRDGGLLKVYEVDAAISGGMSGGPTVDTAGRVIGVNSFGVSGESQPFNFVRPTSIVTELMGRQGIDNVVAPVTVQYRAGLDAFFAGDKARAVEQLELVTQEQPANGLAQDYLRKARALADAAPVSIETAAIADDGGGGSSTMIIVVLAALLVLALGGGGALFLRQRPRAATAGGPASVGAPAGWGPTPPAQPGPPAPAPNHSVTVPAGAALQCPACSAPVPAGQRFCGSCGSAA